MFKKRRMNDDLDPGPYVAPRGRNRTGRWRSLSAQRSRLPFDRDWRRNMNDPQPEATHRGPNNHGNHGPNAQAGGHRRGRAGFNNNTRRPANANQGRSFENNNTNFARKKYIGFKRLEEIALSASQDALAKLMDSKDAFIDFIQSPIEKLDFFVLIIKCMAKVCESSFDQLKLSLLRDTCNSNFIVSLKSYLMDLPYAQEKAANNMYWKDEDDFWKNLTVFFECIVNTSPTLALNKCRSLVEATSIACLEGLKERHSYVLPQESALKLKDLRERMADFEKKKETSQTSHRGFKPEDGTPPENFRELTIMPTKDDFLQKAFVRPNLVNGAYQDVEHYLDVQFRLLREDCFGPLRDGLDQFRRDPNKKRYDHIRIFHNVKFVKPYMSQTKIGTLVQVDLGNNKKFKRINWNNSKRFIYGSLVLFTKDNFKSFIVATILDRDAKYLMEGMIPVTLIDAEFNERLYNGVDTYTMIESEVYFEPYYHVLCALQDPSFPEHIAMKQYIVDVNPEPKPPSYLKPTTQFAVRSKEYEKTQLDCALLEESCFMDSDSDEDSLTDDKVRKKKFIVLQEQTWPGKDYLQFNESQLEAYQLALTHEFAVIQGPPGTGKTYLGIKVAKTLLENLRSNGCLMLVICYTNHALDQFLEALLKVTPSIARIGGQSRNEALDSINLKNLRHNIGRHATANEAFHNQKLSLKKVVSEFQRATVFFDVLLNGVVKVEMLSSIPGVDHLNIFYNRREDVLFHWLFENIADYYSDDIDELLLEENATSNAYDDHGKETRKRTGVQLDEKDNLECEQNQFCTKISSFSLEETKSKIRELIVLYNKCPDLALKRNIKLEIQYLQPRIELFEDMSQYRTRRINVRITERTNFNGFSPIDRWTLYFTWIEDLVTEQKNEIGEIQARVNTATTEYEEARMLLDMQVLNDKKIVGMTTSGAARMRKLLQTLKPRIVIVEEAAEVLEQHIVTSLTKTCEHLILIGDHQQLRPSASHIKLAKHFQIEVSLFERMITNGIHSRRLRVQHRMRPEIAALICPHIYADLENHPTVYDFPDVKGMTKNLFFYTHDHKEEVTMENMSRTNHKEADLVLAFANYLMQQGYNADEVTILAAYKGQMFYMRKESEKNIHLLGVKITVVDNYQGEESKIILLSLVRNNDENRIGFLGTPNRICVALSRAKEGFYIFGNMDTLKATSELWKNIAKTLEDAESLGSTLTLKCQNHPDNLTIIQNVKDFEEVPEGGCKSVCNFTLRSCGHSCLLFCHGYDRDHTSNYTRCPRGCERVLCELGHVCPKKCAEDCGPCMRKVTKTLPCGHDESIYCHLEPDDESVKCSTMVEVALPICGHKIQKQCHVDVKEVRCPIKCDYRVEKCGHVCLLNCHVNKDPDHEKYICKKQCAKPKAGCTAGLVGDRGDHQCTKRCYETCDDCLVQVVKRRSTCKHLECVACTKNVDEIPCTKKCARKLPCEHFCKLKCCEKCGDCKEMVTKEIPDCKHKIKMECKQVPIRKLCKHKCQRIMSCGHQCKGICGDECNPKLCTEPSGRKVTSPCGHDVILPCKLAALPRGELQESEIVSACSAPCGAQLACAHVCGGTCARCRRAALHAPCTQPCNQINICGHQCEEPCNQICPPCKKQCEVRCVHSRCRQQCGAPCTTCKEKCGRRCAHGGACRRRCGEPCARAACDAACARRLACGHACRGLCGEPCPPVCRRCDPDNFPRDFLGDEYDDDAKFVLLQDCGHVMEVEDLDTMMYGDSDTVEIRKCPLCRKPIINTGRYKDLVNKIFKEEIDPVKRKIFGTDHQINQKKNELNEKIMTFRKKYLNVLNDKNGIRFVYLNIKTIAETSKKVSKLHLDMQCICFNILDLIAETYKQYLDAKLTELKTELDEQTKMLCKVFEFKLKAGVMLKVSEQQQKDMALEIKRMNSIVQLSKLISHTLYISTNTSPQVQTQYEAARAAVFTWLTFDEKKTMATLKNLQEVIKVSGVISKQERDLIVKAIGLKAGHWYKCPKGHFYCIADCGGAMVESKCPDCGAVIGGTNHRLTGGNAHAPEMDGSRYPAWSEGNNMANFGLL